MKKCGGERRSAAYDPSEAKTPSPPGRNGSGEQRRRRPRAPCQKWSTSAPPQTTFCCRKPAAPKLNLQAAGGQRQRAGRRRQQPGKLANPGVDGGGRPPWREQHERPRRQTASLGSKTKHRRLSGGRRSRASASRRRRAGTGGKSSPSRDTAEEKACLKAAERRTQPQRGGGEE